MKKMLSMILVAVGLTFGASAFAAPPPAAEGSTQQELAKPGKEPRAEKREERKERKERKDHHKGRRGQHRKGNHAGRKDRRHPRRG